MIDLDRLKSETDIVDVARDLGLEPKKSGVNFVAHCPNHDTDDRYRNLTLNAKKRKWGGAICFVCGFKVDPIELVMKVRGLERGEAIRWLADRVGLRDEPKTKKGLGYTSKPKPTASYPKPAPLPAPAATPSSPIAQDLTEAALQLFKVDWPANLDLPIGLGRDEVKDADGSLHGFYTRDDIALINDFVANNDPMIRAALTLGAKVIHLKPAGPKASLRVKVYEALLGHTVALPADVVAWLTTKKGITEATVTAFGLRWLKDWETADRELRKTFGDEALIGLGLVRVDDKTKKPVGLRFKNHRLLFPFWLTVADRRWPVYLQARNIHATEAKYRFDNPSGDACPCPYNVDALAQARDAGQPIFIVEGLTDTLTIAQSGRFACGIPGAQRWKPDWAKSFADLDVYITRDADDAGEDFTRKVTQSFIDASLHAPKVVKLPAGQDVTDFFTGQTSKKTAA